MNLPKQVTNNRWPEPFVPLFPPVPTKVRREGSRPAGEDSHSGGPHDRQKFATKNGMPIASWAIEEFVFWSRIRR
jgi:hypothetical protein